MRKPTKEIKLTSYDDLLGINENENTFSDKVVEVPLSELFPFENHPFKVRDDEKMQETAESIRNYGVLNPGLVRPRKAGGYEIVAGHRRKRGCELAGKEVMPVLIRNYSDDEAVVIMVDSNIQRENILPSEKAFAYQMKLEALKHQGVKTGNDGETADLVGKNSGESGRTVQRYIRLTKLLPELLEQVDAGKIKVGPAEKLSFLSETEQEWILQCVQNDSVSVGNSAAGAIKKHSEAGELTKVVVELILCGEKKEIGKITLSDKVIQKYFPKDFSKQKIEKILMELLDEWKRKQ